ncbi:MAG TPA: HlyC/CorC family transporter [Gammaproteobacteria bacterium]|nr:HlyC/CorC family transporter [Gammaproteobacteria bacterium]
METIPLSILFGVLCLLILMSGFFSSSETGMMALNRYRLRHLVEDRHRGAMLASTLLHRPDRLIGLILLGNNLVNFAAASLATAIAVRLFGELGYAIAPLVLTPVVLVFAETAPKTFAAIRPEKIAFPSAYVLTPLLKLCYPFVFIINQISNGVIRIFGINPEDREDIPMSREELRTVVREAGAMIPRRHQRMLISILDLEKETVDDIMVPRNELVGIDLNDPTSDILDQLMHCQHTRLLVYRDNIDNIVGILHVRRLPRIMADKSEFNAEELEKIVSEPYYVPESTPLHTQLMNFQRWKRRTGLVVDEYGVILGMVTLEDILEEIVGEFTTDMQTFNQDIHPQEDGSFIIDGTATLRDINRQLHWNLPSVGPKTLNGLILEQLETIPEAGTSLRVGCYTIEITQAAGNAVKTARITVQPDESPAQKAH